MDKFPRDALLVNGLLHHFRARRTQMITSMPTKDGCYIRAWVNGLNATQCKAEPIAVLHCPAAKADAVLCRPAEHMDTSGRGYRLLRDTPECRAALHQLVREYQQPAAPKSNAMYSSEAERWAARWAATKRKAATRSATQPGCECCRKLARDLYRLVTEATASTGAIAIDLEAIGVAGVTNPKHIAKRIASQPQSIRADIQGVCHEILGGTTGANVGIGRQDGSLSRSHP